jgi:catechol 2,3-dioxygenase-like lactoylglutathione lyase family enzyme
MQDASTSSVPLPAVTDAGSAGAMASSSDAADPLSNGEDAGEKPTSAARALCSGCPSEHRDPKDTQIRIHHVHLNSHDVAESNAFYAKFFGTEPVRLNGVRDALWAEPILFLIDQVDYTFTEQLQMGFEHAGIGVDDPTAWFDAASKQGLVADTRNGAPEMVGTLNEFTYIYVRGPNGERIEVWSGLKKFRHLHFMTPNVDETVAWYQALLGVAPMMPNSAATLGLANAIELDGAQLNFLAIPVIDTFIETDHQPIGHFALSVPNLDALYERAQQLGLTIVSPPAPTDFGFRSFFVRAPQKALMELVEAGPLRLADVAMSQ